MAERPTVPPHAVHQRTGSPSTEIGLPPPERAGALTVRRRRRKVTWIIGASLVLLGAGISLAVADPFTLKPTGRQNVADNSYPTSLATVNLQTITSQTPVNATLGYAGSYSAVNHATGTYTWLPTVGQVVTPGQVLYRVDGHPVVLLNGSTPAYRSLAEGASASEVTGADVVELNADLVASGYAPVSEIPAGSDQFSWWTKQGVEKLQGALGETENGILALGDVVFLPGAARVTNVSATLGGPAGPGQAVLSATSTTRQVTINLDAAEQAQVNAGDKVTITLPDGATTPGVISSVGTVATAASGGGSSSTPTVTVQVSPTHPADTGSIDQAPVEVSITTATVNDALVVPVVALTALSGGGYAVEVVDSQNVHHLVQVDIGIFDDADGIVQVSCTGLTAGQHVVVPGP